MASGVESKKICLHPELLCEKEFYLKIRDFENGRTHKVSKYLKRYDSESARVKGGTKAFESRLARLYNKNFIKPYLFLHLGHLSQDVTLNVPEGETWDAIKQDSNRYGLSYKSMAREMIIDYMLEGRCGVLVDGPPAVGPTLKDAKARKERSWQVLYEAKDILYWEFFTDPERMGELKELVLRDKLIERDEKYYQRIRRFETVGDVVRFEVLEAEKNQEILGPFWDDAQDFVIKDGGELQIDRIPFVFFGQGQRDAFFSSIVDLNDAHLNRGSVRSNIVYNQGFQRVVFFGVTEQEIARVGEWLATAIKSKDGKVEIVPAGDPVAATDELASIENYITRAGKMEWNQLSDDTRQVQSADSKRLDQNGRKALYDYVLDSLEEVLTKVYRLHALFEGADTKAISVRIEREYGLEDETVTMLDEQQLFDWAGQMNVPSVRKELMKLKASRIKWAPSKKETREDVLERLIKDIEAAEAAPAQGSGLAGVFGRIGIGQNPPSPSSGNGAA